MIVRWGIGEPVSFFSGRAVFWLFVCTFIFKNIGYNMLIWLSGLSAIPVEIYDAAKVDGAGRFTQIWKITLPNIKRPFFIVAMLSIRNISSVGFIITPPPIPQIAPAMLAKRLMMKYAVRCINAPPVCRSPLKSYNFA